MTNKYIATLLIFLAAVVMINFIVKKSTPPNDTPPPASNKIYETLSTSIKSQMAKLEADTEVKNAAFADSPYVKAWLAEMSRRLSKRITDANQREEFLNALQYESIRAGLDPEMVLGLIEVESDFRKYAVSSNDAQGYMQVPKYWLERIGSPEHNLFHLRTNLRYGITILRHYIDTENGDLYQALNKYNSNPQRTTYADKVYAAWRNNWTYGPSNKKMDAPSNENTQQSKVIANAAPVPTSPTTSLPGGQTASEFKPSREANFDNASPSALPKPSAKEVFSEASKGVYMLVALRDEILSQGSGVVIYSNLIITNHHVIKDTQEIYAKKGEKVFPLKLVMASAKKDIAVLRADTLMPSIKQIRIFDTLAVGEKVYSISSPKGLENTLSEGIISGLRTHQGVRYIQTTTPITSGSSGGALLDEYGRLIGITTSGANTGNLNFAVAIDEVDGIK